MSGLVFTCELWQCVAGVAVVVLRTVTAFTAEPNSEMQRTRLPRNLRLPEDILLMAFHTPRIRKMIASLTKSDGKHGTEILVQQDERERCRDYNIDTEGMKIEMLPSNDAEGLFTEEGNNYRLLFFPWVQFGNSVNIFGTVFSLGIFEQGKNHRNQFYFSERQC